MLYLKEKLANALESFLVPEPNKITIDSIIITLLPLKVENFYTPKLQKQFSEIIEELEPESKRVNLFQDKVKVMELARKLFSLYKEIVRIEYTKEID